MKILTAEMDDFFGAGTTQKHGYKFCTYFTASAYFY